jgi:hypothetical protein
LSLIMLYMRHPELVSGSIGPTIEALSFALMDAETSSA